MHSNSDYSIYFQIVHYFTQSDGSVLIEESLSWINFGCTLFRSRQSHDGLIAGLYFTNLLLRSPHMNVSLREIGQMNMFLIYKHSVFQCVVWVTFNSQWLLAVYALVELLLLNENILCFGKKQLVPWAIKPKY